MKEINKNLKKYNEELKKLAERRNQLNIELRNIDIGIERLQGAILALNELKPKKEGK